jgi:hypothetical protein
MVLGEVGGPVYLLRFLATGPLLALLVLLPPVLVLQGAAGRPAAQAPGAVTGAAVLLAVALAAELAWLRTRRPPS